MWLLILLIMPKQRRRLVEGLNSRRVGWVEEEEKECVCDGGDQSQTAVPRYTPCFRRWAIMRGLPEPVGLSRALTLPTLSQQAANACSPISAQDSATCKEFYVVHIFYYLNKSRSYSWRLKERSDALRPKNKTIFTVKKKKVWYKPNISADQEEVVELFST